MIIKIANNITLKSEMNSVKTLKPNARTFVSLCVTNPFTLIYQWNFKVLWVKFSSGILSYQGPQFVPKIYPKFMKIFCPKRARKNVKKSAIKIFFNFCVPHLSTTTRIITMIIHYLLLLFILVFMGSFKFFLMRLKPFSWTF